MAKKVPISNEDRKKSYFKYYADAMYYGEQEKYDMISQTPGDNAAALRIEAMKRSRFFEYCTSRMSRTLRPGIR